MSLFPVPRSLVRPRVHLQGLSRSSVHFPAAHGFNIFPGVSNPDSPRPRLLPAPPPPGPPSPGRSLATAAPTASQQHPILNLHEDEDRSRALGGLLEESEDNDERESLEEEAEEIVTVAQNDVVPPLSPCFAKKSSNHYQSEMFFHERREFLRRYKVNCKTFL